MSSSEFNRGVAQGAAGRLEKLTRLLLRAEAAEALVASLTQERDALTRQLDALNQFLEASQCGECGGRGLTDKTLDGDLECGSCCGTGLDYEKAFARAEAAESLAASRLGEIAQLRERLLTLVGAWEESADAEFRSNSQYAQGLNQCANELRAVAAPLVLQHDEEKKDDAGLLGTTAGESPAGPEASSLRCGVCDKEVSEDVVCADCYEAPRKELSDPVTLVLSRSDCQTLLGYLMTKQRPRWLTDLRVRFFDALSAASCDDEAHVGGAMTGRTTKAEKDSSSDLSALAPAQEKE